MTAKERKIFIEWLVDFIWTGILLLMMVFLFFLGLFLI